jgi:hypothetical protein
MRAKLIPLEVKRKKELEKRKKLDVRKALEMKGLAKRMTRREKEAVFLRLHAAEFEKFSQIYDLYCLESDNQLLGTIWPDSSVSEEAKLELLKSLPEWPHAVLCLYEEAFYDAKQQKKADRTRGRPRDIAYETVGKALGLKEDRVHALCKEGRRYRRQNGPVTVMPAGRRLHDSKKS